MGNWCSTHKRIEAEKVAEEQAVHGTVGNAPLTPATLPPEEQPPPRQRLQDLEMSPPSSPGDEYPWKSSDVPRPTPIVAVGRLALPAIHRDEERGAEGGRGSRSGSGGAVDGGHGSEEVTRRRKRTSDVEGGDSDEQTTRLSKFSLEQLPLTGKASSPAEQSGVGRQLHFRQEPADGTAAGTVSRNDSEVMVVRPVTPDTTPMLTYEDIVRERMGIDRRRSRDHDHGDSTAVPAAAAAETGAREGEAAVAGGDRENAPPRQEARPAVAATAGAARGDAEDLFVVDCSNENDLSVERTLVSLKWAEGSSTNSLLNADEEDFMESLLLDD